MVKAGQTFSESREELRDQIEFQDKKNDLEMCKQQLEDEM